MVTKTKPKAMYTVREAADLLCVTMKTVRDYVTTGKLRAVRRGRGHYLVYEKDLRAFLGMEADESLTGSAGDES